MRLTMLVCKGENISVACGFSSSAASTCSNKMHGYFTKTTIAQVMFLSYIGL